MRPSPTLALCFALCGFSILAPSSTGYAQDVPAAISYRVTFDQAQAHYVHIEGNFTSGENGLLEVYLPVWTPGSYLVREYARHLDSISAEDSDAKELAIQKISKNRWQVVAEPNAKVVIRYRVYCNELTVRTNYVDHEFAMLNGAATFLTQQSARYSPHQVRFDLRDGWSRSATSLRRPTGSEPHQYVASTYDELVDSPVILGKLSVHPFDVGGVTHYLVNQGGEELWDGERAAADVSKLVAEHQRMWGNIPYDRYFVLNLITETGGGLEHDSSTLVMTSRWSFRNRRSYQRWLSLVSHEFFHTWNVRRLRPKALVNYDYQNENYFEELWMAEGATSYYEDLALVRSGLMSSSEFLATFSRQIEQLQGTPGRTRQSLSGSSHDTWIKFYRPDENSKNVSISYYNKGAVAAFLLDAELRSRSKGKVSLDHVMRKLFTEHSGDVGYTNEDVRKACEQLTTTDFSEWFERSISSTQELDYSTALDWLGLRFRGEPKQQDTPQPKTAEAKAQRVPSVTKGGPWLGMSTTNDDGILKVRSVTEDSPAFKAGFCVDDELLGINGYRLGSSLTDRLQQYKVGDTIEIMMARRGKIDVLPVHLDARESQSWALERVRKPSAAQKQAFEDWLSPSPDLAESSATEDTPTAQPTNDD